MRTSLLIVLLSSNGNKDQSADEKSQSITVDYWLCLNGILDMICDTGNHHVGQNIITECNEPCRNDHVRAADEINGSIVGPDRFCHKLVLGWIVYGRLFATLKRTDVKARSLYRFCLTTTLPSFKINE